VSECGGRDTALGSEPPCTSTTSSRHPSSLNHHPSPFLADLLARGGPEAEALEQAILTRLVALNHERAAEEKRGLVRWLRPDFQAPPTSSGQAGAADPGHRPLEQTEMEGVDTSDPSSLNLQPSSFLPWPDEAPAQVAAIRKLLPTVGKDPEALSACFGRKAKKRTDQIAAIIATLESLGYW
jgi:hypothetical protein